MGSILKDGKFIVFLLIVAGFWTMYNQLFFTLPVFISQWVDTSVLYDFFQAHFPFISHNYSPAPGVMDPEFVTNIDALYIILFQVMVSSVVMKMKPLRSMMSGFLVCAVGMSLTLAFQNVLFTMVAILVFSLGEMAGSPKITEYIGRIAPADQEGFVYGLFLYSDLFRECVSRHYLRVGLPADVGQSDDRSEICGRKRIPDPGGAFE